MPTVTSVPGVYIEEDTSPAISVSAGATAVPLFVARFTPHKQELEGVITRISSWLDYTTLFDSKVTSSANVTVTSTAKENQQETKLSEKSEHEDVTATQYTYTIDGVVVVDHTASIALKLYFQNGGGPCYLYPLDKVSGENKLDSLPKLIDEVGDITLFACPESDDTYRMDVYGVLANSLSQNKGYFLLADSSDGNVPVKVSNPAQVAVYYPSVAVPHQKIDDSQIHVNGYKNSNDNAVNTLKELRGVNPDFAKVVDQQLLSKLIDPMWILPSALMAGVYCKTDCERGVWKAPANVVLNGVRDVSDRVTNEKQADFNTKGINVIRHFSDSGLVVWGCRTQQDDDNWRYIPVRRLFDSAERDIKKALRPMVFEPNSQPTWIRVQTAIEHYLYSLWQQGGLAGNKAEEAYFVRIGKDITMTQNDINQGKMIIQVGMAAVRPAEFIILKFTQDMSQ